MELLSHSCRFRDAEFRELGFNDVIHFVFAAIVGDPDRVLDGIRIRPAMANDRNSLDAKQRSAAIFRIIKPPAKRAECLLSENVSDFRGNRLLQFLPEHGGERFDKAFAQLQRDVAGETIADDNVDLTFENVAAFTVADEVDRGKLQRLERFLREFVSLRVFLTD